MNGMMKVVSVGMTGAVLALAAASVASAAARPAAHAQKSVTITFWNEMTGPYEVALDKVMHQFEKTHRNIRINNVVVSNDATLEPKLLAALVGNNPPTISQMNPNWASGFVKTGSLYDMSGFIHSKQGFSLSPFFKGLLKAGQFSGHQYILPFNVSSNVMYYNETQFKQAGITSAPRTWTQFQADAKKLSTNGRHAFAITLVHTYPFRTSVIQAGGEFVLPSGKPNPGVFKGNGAATKALEMWSGMVKNGSAILTQGYGSQTDFANGTSSILEGTSAFYPYLAQAVAGKFTIGIAPVPGDKNDGTAAFGGYLGVFNQASSAQKTAAMEFVKFLTSKQGQTIWMEDSEGYLPVRNDVAPGAQKFLATHPAQRVALSVMGRAQMSPRVSWWNQFSNQYLINDITAVLDNKMSALSAMHQAYQQAEQTYSSPQG